MARSMRESLGADRIRALVDEMLKEQLEDAVHDKMFQFVLRLEQEEKERIERVQASIDRVEEKLLTLSSRVDALAALASSAPAPPLLRERSFDVDTLKAELRTECVKISEAGLDGLERVLREELSTLGNMCALMKTESRNFNEQSHANESMRVSPIKPSNKGIEDTLVPAVADANSKVEMPDPILVPKELQIAPEDAERKTGPEELHEDEADAEAGLSMDTTRAYEFSESMWDAALLIGHRSQQMGGSMLLVLLLLINLFAVLVFVGITMNLFTEPQFSDESVRELLVWRRNIGQNAKYFDKLTLTSLTERVCSGVGLEMSDNKNGLIESINNYLGKEGPMQIFSGPSLMMVAVFCWSVTVIRELSCLWNLVGGLRQIPLGDRTMLASTEEGGFRIQTLSRPRFVYAGFIVLLRLVIAIVLLQYGNVFLVVYNIEPTDILLNAVALEVVLCVDEVIFEALAPAQTRAVVTNLEPLRFKGIVRRGMDLKVVVFLLCLTFNFSFSYFMYVDPLVAQIKQARTNICGGNTAFVYDLDAFYIVHTIPTDPWGVKGITDIDAQPFSQSIFHSMFPERFPLLVKDANGTMVEPPISTWEVANVAETVETMRERASGGLSKNMAMYQTAMGDGRGCSDILNLFFTFYMKGDFEYIGQDPPATCEAASVYCNYAAVGAWIRAVCPRTCGCDKPLILSGLASKFGCPALCSAEGPDLPYTAALATLKCTDANHSAHLAIWQGVGEEAANSFYGLTKDYPVERQLFCGDSSLESCIAKFSSGCGIAQDWAHWTGNFSSREFDACAGDWMGEFMPNLRPLNSLCPETCNCTRRLAEGMGTADCPTRCA